MIEAFDREIFEGHDNAFIRDNDSINGSSKSGRHFFSVELGDVPFDENSFSSSRIHVLSIGTPF